MHRVYLGHRAVVCGCRCVVCWNCPCGCVGICQLKQCHPYSIVSNPFYREMASVLSRRLFYIAAMMAYSVRFEEKCASSSTSSEGLRDAVILLAVIQTGGTVAYATLSQKLSSMLSLAVSMIAAAFAIAATGAYYAHGGQTIMCANQENEEAENVFEEL